MGVNFSKGYSPPPLLKGKHLQTIYPAIFRKVKDSYHCEKKILTLEDGDELHYDHYQNAGKKAVIISHGLEGNSQKSYVRGMANILLDNGYDIIAWNFRSCHGALNKTPRFYHSGATEDLESIVKMVSRLYERINLVGFSLGANLTLKFAGEPISDKYQIEKIAAICAPLDLKSGSENIGKRANFIYERRFLKSLKNKIIEKDKIMPGVLPISDLIKVKKLYDFDNYFTAPIHGFKNAEDYYKKCSSIYFVEDIKSPTLIINALNDPMIPKETINIDQFNSLKYVTLELTKEGGHCGFPKGNKQGYYWDEERVLNFFNAG